jgi:hypothetical protein
MNELLSRRLVDGAGRLALRFPAGALKAAGPALSAAFAEEGALVTGAPSLGGARGAVAGAESWRFESLAGEGEEAFLLGPELRGEASSLADPASFEEGFSALLALARALAFISAEGRLPRGLVASGLLVAKDESWVLLLPATAVAKAARGPRAWSTVRPLGTSGGSAEAEASFLLAQAAYLLASGRAAFETEARESGGLTPLPRPPMATLLASPSLDPGLAVLVDRALAEPGRTHLSEWVATLEAAREGGWRRELGPELEADLSLRRAAFETREKGRRVRSDFFRRRGSRLLVVGTLVLVLGMVAADIVRARLARPDYSWLTPRELVQRYYLAIDSLDMESLEACGERGAIKEDQGMLVNLVVITRTRTGYEGRSPLVRAVDWLAAGKPALAQSDLLYGITGLSLSGGEGAVPDNAIATKGSGGEEARIRAEYSLWSLERVEDASGDPGKTSSRPREERRVDELRLARGKRGWSIAAIGRTRAP